MKTSFFFPRSMPSKKISFKTEFHRIRDMYYQSLCEEKPVYESVLERWNMYKSIWLKHWLEFEKIYPSRFEKLYGPLDEEKVDEVKNLYNAASLKIDFKDISAPIV